MAMLPRPIGWPFSRWTPPQPRPEAPRVDEGPRRFFDRRLYLDMIHDHDVHSERLWEGQWSLSDGPRCSRSCPAYGMSYREVTS